MGESGFASGVDGEKEETCRRMANSSVAFVSLTMLLRKASGTFWTSLWLLIALDS